MTPSTSFSTSTAETLRGRTRDRGSRAGDKPSRTEESSTLRGRSRQRALSPRGSASRNPSPSLLSPSRHILLHNQLREKRRGHCPSRAASPNGRRPSLQRGRRTPSVRRATVNFPAARDAEPHRAAEHMSHSSLRHEFVVGQQPADASRSDDALCR